MPNDAAAKYFYKNNSIYFSSDRNLEDLNTLAVHECLHFVQLEEPALDAYVPAAQLVQLDAPT